jgi:4'-phosphopantetheinyl transferase
VPGSPLVRAWIVGPPRAERLAELEAWLDPGELSRARRLRRPADRERFVATRGLLRELLGRELGLAPEAVRLSLTEGGKPFLAGADLRFNVAHSGSRSAIALASGCEVGIDVERLREDLDLVAVAPRTLSPPELRAWGALAEGERRRAFFAAWARKEAYLKARGEGLRLGLESIEVSPGPAPGVALARETAAPAPPWAVRDLDAGPGYAAAVCAPGTDWELRVEAGPPARRG